MRGLAVSVVMVSMMALSACGDESDPDGGAGDAGTAPDAATIDAGGSMDGGAVDGGSTTDGGGAVDSGMASADGSLLAPLDAGDPFGDAGALGPPAWVPLDVLLDGTCEALTPCGGAIEGTWDVTGGCIEAPLGDALSACPGATLTASGRARGRVTFGPVIATRQAQTEVIARANVPSLCAAFVGGCAGLETQIRMAVPDARCVALASGDCRCEARQVNVIDDGDAYTTEGTQIVSSSLDRRWDYCVEGTGMRYRETSGEEPGIIELGRR